jgi:soluble lytic murein transglycosylase-like protein
MALETIDSGEVTVKAPQTKGGLNVQGNIALDPTQTETILQNMQKIIEERENPLSQIAGGLSRGMATAAGPSSLIAYDRQKQLEEKEMMDYRTQMAGYRAAQAQAAEQAKRLQAGFGGTAPTTGGTAPTTGGLTYNGVSVPPTVQAQLNSVGTAAEKEAIIQDWLKTERNESIKKANAPALADVVEIYIPGQGNVQMTKAMAEQYLNKLPNLKAVVNGKQVPAAQVLAPTTADTSTKAAMPKTEVPLENLSTPFYAQESSSGKADTSKPGIQGAQGPMQVTKDTFDTYKSKGIIPKDYDLNDPGQAYASGILILNDLHKKHGKDINKVAAEYFGGPGAINADGSINVGRADATGKTVGSYVNDIRTRMGLPKVDLAAAPAETATTTTAAAPATRAEYEQQQKEQQDIIASRVKEGEIKRTSVLDAREQSIETGNALNRIESTLNTPEGIKAVGVFQKPGVVSMFGKILQNGIQAGNFGAVSFKDLDDAIRAGGGDQKTIDAAQRLARDFAQMQLNIAKRDLKGQGAVSDNERRIVEHVTGSTANSPAVLKDFVRWNKTRNEFDKQVGDALQNWEEKNPNKSFTKFKETKEYKKMEADYIAKTNQMANTMGLSGGKAPKGEDKTDEYLKQYLNPGAKK